MAVDMHTALPAGTRLFRRNLAQQYRHSSLGLFWAFLPSIVTAIALSIGQQTHLVATKQGVVPAPYYGVFGLAVVQSLLDGMNTLRIVFEKYSMILKRNNVPLEGMLMSGVLETLFGLAVRLLMLIIVSIVFHVRPVASVLLAVVAMSGFCLCGCGIGMFLAPFTSLKKDLDNILPYLPWIIFATTPVFTQTPAASPLTVIHKWNPLTYPLGGVRHLAYGAHGSVLAALLMVPLGMALTSIGWIFCRMWRPYITERML